MKVNIFKKLIRDIIREELDYKFTVLENKLNEVLVSNRSNSIVEDIGAQLNSSPTKKTNVQSQVPTPTLPSNNVPLTKDNILNEYCRRSPTRRPRRRRAAEPRWPGEISKPLSKLHFEGCPYH